jgi:hypothetical protein
MAHAILPFSAHIIDLAKEGERDPDKLCEGL